MALVEPMPYGTGFPGTPVAAMTAPIPFPMVSRESMPMVTFDGMAGAFNYDGKRVTIVQPAPPPRESIQSEVFDGAYGGPSYNGQRVSLVNPAPVGGSLQAPVGGRRDTPMPLKVAASLSPSAPMGGILQMPIASPRPCFTHAPALAQSSVARFTSAPSGYSSVPAAGALAKTTESPKASPLPSPRMYPVPQTVPVTPRIAVGDRAVSLRSALGPPTSGRQIGWRRPVEQRRVIQSETGPSLLQRPRTSPAPQLHEPTRYYEPGPSSHYHFVVAPWQATAHNGAPAANR
mmetsp:Transcript_67596/g.188647  ORF Transcript_67596/g.188647 Transcript_67596/m.188647 type:complete len:289 (-) Transcript_67596:176-1042(-)